MILELLLAALVAGCVPVESEKISARDLAAVEPAFAALAPETTFGYAPAPGARRVLRAAELKRLAAPQDLPLPAGAEVCIVRPLESLTQERLIASMRASLPDPDARIEVVEFSGFGAPRGEIRFPLAGLRQPPARAPRQAVLWKGYVEYAGGRRYPIWAKVRIGVLRTRVVADRDLRAGHLIEPGQVRQETAEVFPAADAFAESVEQVAGRVLVRAVAAGSPLPLKLLAAPRDVERGDPVRVEATSGQAVVAIVGRAESSGSLGDTVVVRNLTSGKSFRAQVTAKGAVAVTATKREETWQSGAR
jgi:flagella basal body P-ring formation protein FlgA